nr:hypothetical protein [Tanacetum cinerariifolium]
ERLINAVKNDISDDSSRDPLLEEADLFLAFDNSIPPGIENVANDSKGDINFLEELLIEDSILSHESSDSNFEDNPSIPRPPPEPPDADFELDFGNEISVVMNKFECLRDEFDDYFMFAKVFSLLSADSEDTIFDPGPINSRIESSLRLDYHKQAKLRGSSPHAYPFLSSFYFLFMLIEKACSLPFLVVVLSVL